MMLPVLRCRDDDHVCDPDAVSLLSRSDDSHSPRHNLGISFRVLAVTGILVMAVVVAVAGSLRASKGFFAARVDSSIVLASDEDASNEGMCDQYPFIRLQKNSHNNLGGVGPDEGKEGIYLLATLMRTGSGHDNQTVEIQIHATSPYTPPAPGWAKLNGIDGHFARINIKHGTNVSFEISAHNLSSEEIISLPKAGMSFFDLDTGVDGNHSVEYVTVANFTHSYITKKSELLETKNADGSTTFTATREADGTDNPEDPLFLTMMQKHKSVTLEFENVEKIPVTIGASDGKTHRVFMFTARPVLRCAQTTDGTVEVQNSFCFNQHLGAIRVLLVTGFFLACWFY